MDWGQWFRRAIGAFRRDPERSLAQFSKSQSTTTVVNNFYIEQIVFDNSINYGTRTQGNVNILGNLNNAFNTINNIDRSTDESKTLSALLKTLHDEGVVVRPSGRALVHAQDKIIISRGPDGHFVYFSVKDSHGGTIIDLAKRYVTKNFGHIRKTLREWSDGRTGPAHAFAATPLETTSKDLQAVAKLYFKDDTLTIATLDPQPVGEKKPRPAAPDARHIN